MNIATFVALTQSATFGENRKELDRFDFAVFTEKPYILWKMFWTQKKSTWHSLIVWGSRVSQPRSDKSITCKQFWFGLFTPVTFHPIFPSGTFSTQSSGTFHLVLFWSPAKADSTFLDGISECNRVKYQVIDIILVFVIYTCWK